MTRALYEWLLWPPMAASFRGVEGGGGRRRRVAAGDGRGLGNAPVGACATHRLSRSGPTRRWLDGESAIGCTNRDEHSYTARIGLGYRHITHGHWAGALGEEFHRKEDP